MKPTMLIPILAMSLVAASASLSPASACAPAGPGQCCAGAQFSENGQYCRIVHCLGQGPLAKPWTPRSAKRFKRQAAWS